MLRKLILGTLLTILFTATLTTSLNIQPIKAQTSWEIYIRADGSIDPPAAPISTSNNVTYTFTSSFEGCVHVERDNIILAGAGYTLEVGPIVGGVVLTGRTNVTVQNAKITGGLYGIFLDHSSHNTISSNTITYCSADIYLYASSYNTISENSLSAFYEVVSLVDGSSSNIVYKNSILDAYSGVYIDYKANGNNVSQNIIDVGWQGVYIGWFSSSNTIFGNDIKNNQYGVYCEFTLGNNQIHHNNFINNTQQAFCNEFSGSTWDNGYPSGGNFWSDYNSTDSFRGASQNIPGSDGIGDTHYIIDAGNVDHYPLMGPFGASTSTGLNVTVFPAVDVGLTFENVTGTGSTTTNKADVGPPLPPNSTLVGQYVDIKTTAAFSGNVSVRVIYDDSNMTLEQENSLQLLQWLGELCDVTGPVVGVPDGVVNMRDIGYFCSKFNTHPSSPNWDLRCDVTGPVPFVPDGVVNMRDIGMVCGDFLETGPLIWADITTYVDVDSNIIYGEANEFSMFGVTR